MWAENDFVNIRKSKEKNNSNFFLRLNKAAFFQQRLLSHEKSHIEFYLIYFRNHFILNQNRCLTVI